MIYCHFVERPTSTRNQAPEKADNFRCFSLVKIDAQLRPSSGVAEHRRSCFEARRRDAPLPRDHGTCAS